MTDSEIEAFINTYPDRIKLNEPLARFTTFKIGGPADMFFEAKTSDELVSIIRSARKLAIPVFILGGGSNILIGDKGIRGLVIKNNTGTIVMRGVKGERIDGTSKKRVYVEADSGVIFNKLVRHTVEEGLEGLQMHLGLPGTVGGAIFMNSKWKHPEGNVGDVVYQAELLTSENTIKLVPRSYFQFGYDTSSIQRTGDIVTKVIFELTSGDKDTLWNIANDSISYRRTSQPQGIKSAGCTFQNSQDGKMSAGLLIDRAGLKGLRIGDAQISPVHANFIQNLGKATASDVIQLIDRARDQVKSQFGVELEEEILRVGEF